MRLTFFTKALMASVIPLEAPVVKCARSSRSQRAMVRASLQAFYRFVDDVEVPEVSRRRRAAAVLLAS